AAKDHAYPDWCPGGQQHRYLARKAERENDVRQEIEQETRGDAADEQQHRTAASLHPQAEGGRDHHHRAKQEWPAQQPMEVEGMALRRKSRLLEQRYEPRQFPERHRIGRSKALLDLARGQAGREADLGKRLRRRALAETLAVLDHPEAAVEPRAVRLDPRR